jgi:hypothetical protein
MLRVFDASAIVYAWDNYPIGQFPKLWEWLSAEITLGELALSQVAMEEVGHVAPDCHAWLQAEECGVIAVSAAVLTEANKIKGLIGVVGDAFHGDGVDENDVIIVATAKHQKVGLVSDEGQQPDLPKNMKKYKIPAVCGLGAVSVDCCSFLDYLKASKKVF